MAERFVTPTPKVELEIVADRSSDDSGHFLKVRRLDLAVLHEDGRRSAPFAYDVLDRRALDACVMVAHHVEDGRVSIYLRSAVRPPVALRPSEPLGDAVLWEVPAGLIEPGEHPRAAAVRELAEELGFVVTEEELEDLGPSGFPAPGFVGEVQHFFHVRVDASQRREPIGDGSALEQDAAIVSVPLDDAIDACREGRIRDLKTEISLRRLAEQLRGSR